MYKAQEQVVAHTANIDLVGIRNAEINYFSAFFSNFGTQCALIAGFILSSISQVPGIDATCSEFWKYFYWATTAICFITSMHVLLCTVFIAVYGQGLALRGPIGSMVRAVEGMVVEQEQIVFSFVISIIFFTFSTLGTYWIMMDDIGALISSVVTFIGMIFWYHYTLRIYNRFKWSKSTETKWETRSDIDEQPDYVMEREKEFNNRKMGVGGANAAVDGGASGSNHNNNNDNTNSSNNNTTATVTNPMLAKNETAILSAAALVQGTKGNKTVDNMSAKVTSVFKIREGNISVKSKSSGMFSSEQWDRVYGVVTARNALCFYKSKTHYKENPAVMLKNRSVYLAGYQLIIESEQAPFFLKLVPMIKDDIKTPIELKVDHINELQLWAELLQSSINEADELDDHIGGKTDDDDFVVLDGGLPHGNN